MAKMKTRCLENGGLCRREKSGFTLSELLIVVVIVSILAAMIIPRFAGHGDRARAAEAINIMGTIRRGLLAYYDEHVHWPPDATMGNLTAIGATLNTQFTASRYGWSFLVTNTANEAGVIDAICTITADNNATDGVITLDAETGQWNGTVDYAPTGRYFPYLP